MSSTAKKTNVFWVESLDKFQQVKVVPHGMDEDTDEIFFEFLSRANANKHLKAEKKINPDLKYRVVRQVLQFFKPQWE